MQRRQHGRYRIWFPVRLSGPQVDGMALNHNISVAGMLVAVSTKLEIGAVIEVTFHLPHDGSEQRTLRGKVVRVEDNSDDPDGLWPYRMAFSFDDVDSDLIAGLEAAVGGLSKLD